MASNLKLSLVGAQAQANAVAPLANNGFLDIYASAQPTSPETAPGGTALVTLPLPSTFAASIVAGVITAASIAAATAVLGGIALWFRITESDHSTPVLDGSVGNNATVAWAQGTPYALGAVVANGGNAYLCIVAGTSLGSGGGPSGTAASISDNTVTWQYIGLAIGDLNLNSANLVANASISVTSLSLTVPGV